MYRCPKCKSTNLAVTSCSVQGDMDLEEDGFLISGNTSDETVKCKDCDYHGDMPEFMK